jgi:DNA-binding response OmpR family regulator
MSKVAVIYIEDDETEAMLFHYGLSPRGIEVLHVPDSRPESLKQFETDDFKRAAAVFIDLWVGVMNGVDLARVLRTRGDNRPFFLLTNGENPDPPLLQELGVSYLQKPPDFPRLAELILSLAED